MINEAYKAMLGGKSVIRELSEYATARGAEIGYENVFDYSLGNPSVPCPQSFTDEMIALYQEAEPVALHGYSPSLGITSVRTAIAESLNRRFDRLHLPDHGCGRRAGPRTARGDQAWRRSHHLCPLLP